MRGGHRPTLTHRDWRSVLAFYRATAGLAAPATHAGWTAGEVAHARYLAANRLIAHDEDPQRPGYSPAGAAAGRTSNVQIDSGGRISPRAALDEWMSAPFHALGLIDPRLQQTAYGAATVRGWGAAAIDVLRGLASSAPPQQLVVWPADGAQVPLQSYPGDEIPSPLTFCPGYPRVTGLPVLAILPPGVRATGATLRRAGTPVATCLFDGRSAGDAEAQRSLVSRNAVVLVPRRPLHRYVPYTATLQTTAGEIRWSFTSGEVTPPQRPVLGAAAFRTGFQTSTSFTVSWSAHDAESGIASYDVRYRSAALGGHRGHWQRWAGAGSGRQGTFTGVPGREYCFRVRATDRAGNLSRWSRTRCTATPLPASRLQQSGTWLPVTNSAFYDGSALASPGGGSALSVRLPAVRRVALLVARCPACGRLVVSLGGHRLRTLRLAGSSSALAVLPVARWVRPRHGRLRIAAPDTGPPVTVEGVAATRR